MGACIILELLFLWDALSSPQEGLIAQSQKRSFRRDKCAWRARMRRPQCIWNISFGFRIKHFRNTFFHRLQLWSNSLLALILESILQRKECFDNAQEISIRDYHTD